MSKQEFPLDDDKDIISTDFSDEDIELPPPEDKNDANEPNMGNIIGLIIFGILLIFVISFIGLNVKGKSKTKKNVEELDKAGIKTIVEFKESTKESVPISETQKDNQEKNKEEDIEEALNSLPSDLQLPSQGEPGKAPVAPVGSTTVYKSDRPDTRNSKSPRKIDGLASYNYSTVSSSKTSSSQSVNKMTKEEYIALQMAQTQKLQNGLGNSEASNNKDDFFSSSTGGGNGQYLSNAALWDGSIISGALVTAINTDNPGVVIARVTENVYSSKDHSYLLIPEGSLLMATYNSSISYGQNKVQVAWNLLIRPDNYRIQLGNMNGVDTQGASGYKGSVSNHPWETLKALGLIAIYSFIQTEVTNDINAQNNEYLKNMMSDVYGQASSLGNKIVERALDIKPTIKIKEGTEIKFITNIPLELPPVEVTNATTKYIRTK